MPPGSTALTAVADARSAKAGQPGSRRSARCGEQLLAPRARLDHQVAARGQRAVGAEEAGSRGASRLVRRASAVIAVAERLAAHADGVDLVDEDDALAAPLAGQLARLVGERAGRRSRPCPMNICGEARAGDRDERAVEVGGDRLGDHRLAGARRAEEQQAALALAAGLLELLARLPQRDHARDLLLGLGLAADVVDLDAPAGVAGLVAADPAHRHEQERPEEDERS